MADIVASELLSNLLDATVQFDGQSESPPTAEKFMVVAIDLVNSITEDAEAEALALKRRLEALAYNCCSVSLYGNRLCFAVCTI